jgi:hypothetical protein
MPATARSQRLEQPTTALRLVHPEFGYPKAKLIAPTRRGYVYIAAAVEPGPAPFVLPSRRRTDLLRHLAEAASQLRAMDEVAAVDLFRAIVMPPTATFSAYLKERRGSVEVANFDVAMLIQTSSLSATSRVQTLAPYTAVIDMLRRHARRLHVMTAENVRRIGDVETTRDGLFLFNHFVADDRDVMLELWDYLAGWYAAETGLRTSVAMMPVHPTDFTIVNWARWDVHPLRHFWHQLSKRGFWKYVTANLDANHAASMPIYCRLV